VLGPGLGSHKESRDAVKAIIEHVEKNNKPILIDADGIKFFAQFNKKLRTPSVITPHAAEYAILNNKKLPEDFQERITAVKKTAATLRTVILLKGSIDIVAGRRRVKLNFTGNPGMTVGGTGDVLSGIVGAFLAQNVDPFEAAVAGAFINGVAGNLVYKEKGYHMLATDLVPLLPQVMNNLNNMKYWTMSE
jgi:NAD(P)H-hydrate epimerase